MELTDRERQVLDLYAECWSYRVVAHRLGISEQYARWLGMRATRKVPGAGNIGHAVYLTRRSA